MKQNEFVTLVLKSIGEKKIESKKEAVLLIENLAKKHKPKHYPSLMSILSQLSQEEYTKFKSVLVTKPVRTNSGVSVISLMTKPIVCKHGKCTFCPGGPHSYFGNVPMSYTGNEPASLRGARNFYDSYLQVFNRLEQYILLNQIPEKVEVIIQGGTFPSFDRGYQDEFLKYMYKALNDFSQLFFKNNECDFEKFKDFFELPGSVKDVERTKKIQKKVLELRGFCSLEEEQQKNETAKIKCSILCIETKPDWCFQEHINRMLIQGTTRIELGVQTIYEEILRYTNRGHTIQDTIKATQLMKDSFLKTGYHTMPGLPHSSKEMDIHIFKEIFSNPDFRPDSLKIYPCLVMPGTPLFELWKQGKFKPLHTEEAAEIIAESKKYIPSYVRIMRVNRDIPSKYASDGVGITNLRQEVFRLLKKKKIYCQCIRCREPRNLDVDWNSVELKIQKYEASKGEEIFLSYENMVQDKILGFLRLRKPYKPFRKEITNNTLGVRELHVYGNLTVLGEKGNVQHRGLGKKLLEEAERIAQEEYDAKKMVIISGIGVRNYFFKLGYERDGVYVSKKF